MDRTENPLQLGRLRFRARTDRFGIRRQDRRAHVYAIGKTGTGKSTLLKNLARQDIERGEGLTVIDPHGDLVEEIAGSIPPGRHRDLTYLNAPDSKQPYGYNPLRFVSPAARHLASAGLIEVLRKTWDDRSWGPRLEHILRNAFLSLLSRQDSTLEDVLRILSERGFRARVVRDLEDPVLVRFWREEFNRYPLRLRAEAIAPIQTKIGAYLANPLLRRILTAPETPISFRRIMDERKILLVNLSRGQLGEDSSALLGGLIVTTIAAAAFHRARLDPDSRIDHWLYVDEFQSFTTNTVATMLSELRKFRVGLTLAHQYLHQLEPDIQHAVLGNVGTLISFRLGPQDARFLSREFHPKFGAEDLMNLPNHHIRLRLLIDGEPSKPFSAATLAPRAFYSRGSLGTASRPGRSTANPARAA